jgi:hypothetical protein
MAKKKRSRAKKAARKKKPARQKKVTRRKKPSARKKSAMRRKKAPRAARARRRKKIVRRERRGRGAVEILLPRPAGLGPGTGGQSGDIEGLPGLAGANSESVRELAEEGQSYEAEVVDAVEGAPDPDEAELETREVLEDDVPREYDKER